MNTHQFAFFYDNVFSVYSHELVLTDQDLVRRLTTIIRCKIGQSIILFNQKVHVACTIKTISQKNITVFCKPVTTNTLLSPELYVLLPLLKREAFEEAIYNCTELGVTGIQLITTEKCSRQKLQEHEMLRITKIMHAAAEQSKQFAYPNLLNQGKICSLTEFLQQEKTRNFLSAATKLYANQYGTPLKTTLDHDKQSKIYCITIGPEGDFTAHEKQLLENFGFKSSLLTATILRSQQALTIMTGFLRTFLT